MRQLSNRDNEIFYMGAAGAAGAGTLAFQTLFSLVRDKLELMPESN
jgi:hypothetical protein